MKLLVAFGLFSLGAAQLRHWPSWLPRFPGGTPKIPPFITVPGAEGIPPRIFNGLTDPAVNFHIGQSCSVQYEKREYKGTCQKEDDFSKSALGGCPNDVSLYGCGAQRGDGNPLRCCVKVHCGQHYEKYYCRNKSKQPTGLVFSAWHIDTNLCPFAEDIACWVPELGQVESPTLYADVPVEDLATQGTALDPNLAPLQLSSTPSDDLNSGPQVGSDILSSPPSIRRRSSKARTAASSDLEILAAE